MLSVGFFCLCHHWLPKEEITLLLKGNCIVTDAVACILNYLHHAILVNNSHSLPVSSFTFHNCKVVQN